MHDRTTSGTLVALERPLGARGLGLGWCGGGVLSYATSSSSSEGGGGVELGLTRPIASAEGMEALGSALWEAGIGPGHTVLLYGCVYVCVCGGVGWGWVAAHIYLHIHT